MTYKQEIKQQYLIIRNKSFRTKLDLFLFSKCLADRGDIQSFRLEEFNKYSITDEAIKTYAAVYWQREYDHEIGGEKIVNLYSLIETWKMINTKLLADWERFYGESFGKMLPYGYFENLLRGDQCYYCNIKIGDIAKLIDKQKIFKKQETRGFTMEIDRKEPNREYSSNNVVLCCYWCNNAKTDEFTDVEFWSIAAGIRKVWEKRLGRKLSKLKN